MKGQGLRCSKIFCRLLLACICLWAFKALPQESAPDTKTVPGNDYKQPFPAHAWSVDPRYSSKMGNADYAGPRYFPELGDTEYADPKIKAAREKGDPLFGIAFSGGGTRSAAATLGQLQALSVSGWLDKAHYVSAVSGGSWTVVPYMFLPDRYCKKIAEPVGKECDEYFLGDYMAPTGITEELLREPKNKKADPTMRTAISSSKIFLRYIGGLLGLVGDETYARALGKPFLEPFFGYRWRHTLFTHRNVHYKVQMRIGKGVDLEKTARGRPFMIVGTSLLAKKFRALAKDLHPVEITPTYTGIPSKPINLNGRGKYIGGGYVESIGYDTFAPDKQPIAHESPHNVTWKKPFVGFYQRYHFTLRDIIGTSGAAPVQFLANLGIDAIGFPEFNHWPIRIGNEVKHDEFKHGDGGHVDNTGLLPLLVRQVDKIIVFVNSASAFCIDREYKPCQARPFRKPPALYELNRNGQVGVFFHKEQSLKKRSLKVDGKRRRKAGKIVYFGFFEESKFAEMEWKFVERKRAKKPLVHCDQYTIINDDNRFGVSSKKIRNGKETGDPYRPKICWVYLDRTKAWVGELKEVLAEQPRESKKTKYLRQLKGGYGRFKRFPHYQAFFENKWPYPRAIDLKRVQVNALRYLTAWTVGNQAEDIARYLEL